MEGEMYHNKLPNWWGHPAKDPRFQRLLEISRAISDAYDLAQGEQDILREGEMHPDLYHFWPPLRLAQAMEEAAQRIRERTEDSTN
jgi:hypothetical protein